MANGNYPPNNSESTGNTSQETKWDTLDDEVPFNKQSAEQKKQTIEEIRKGLREADGTWGAISGTKKYEYHDYGNVDEPEVPHESVPTMPEDGYEDFQQLSDEAAKRHQEVIDYFKDVNDNGSDKTPDFQPPAVVEQQPDNQKDFQPPAVIEDQPKENPDFQPPAVIEEDEPLTAVNIHREHDAKVAAMHIARERINKELQSKEGGRIRSFLRGIWKGTLAREYYTHKEFEKVYSEIQAKQAGESNNLTDDEWNAFNESTVNRMVDASVEGYEGLLHDYAGEKFYEYNEDATKRAKEIISDYANGKITDAEEFNAAMQEVRNMLGGENVKEGKSIIQDNYLEIANTVKTRVEHGKRLEDVLEGFRVLNAEGRTGVRTKEHEDAVSSIIEKVSNSKFNFIPDAVVAGAVGVGLSVARSQGSRLATMLVPVGGLLVGSAWAAAKEKGRVERDRIQRAQELAAGKTDIGETSYDKTMEQATYTMYESNKLLENLNSAKESNKPSDIIEAIARIETLIAATDSGKEHIKYSAPDKIEAERYALDKALAEARLQLKANPENWKLYEDSREAIYQSTHEALEQDESTADKVFNKLRAKRMAIQAGKTLLIGGVTMVGTQEVVAAFDPKQYGILDEAFNLQNADDAKQTLLARALGFEPKMTIFNTVPEISQRDIALSEQEVKELEEQGMIVNKSRVETTTTQQEVTVNAREVAELEGTPVSRDWAANGTHQPDGNELRAYYTQDRDGLVTGFQGKSTTWAHGEVDPTGAIAQGKVRMMVTLQEGTNPIPVEGTVLPNGQIEFIPEPGSAAASAFKDGVFIGRYAEIGEIGNMVDGRQEFISYATVVGQGVQGDINIVKDVVTNTQLYNVIREVETSEVVRNAAAEVTTGGIPIPFVRRRNLTYSEPGESAEPAPTVNEDEFQPPAVIEQPEGQSSEQPTGEQPTNEQPAGETPPTEPTSEPTPEPNPTPEPGPSEQPRSEQQPNNNIDLDQALFDRHGINRDNLNSNDYNVRQAEYAKIWGTAMPARQRRALASRLSRQQYAEYMDWIRNNHPDQAGQRAA